MAAAPGRGVSQFGHPRQLTGPHEQRYSETATIRKATYKKTDTREIRRNWETGNRHIGTENESTIRRPIPARSDPQAKKTDTGQIPRRGGTTL